MRQLDTARRGRTTERESEGYRSPPPTVSVSSRPSRNDARRSGVLRVERLGEIRERAFSGTEVFHAEGVLHLPCDREREQTFLDGPGELVELNLELRGRANGVPWSFSLSRAAYSFYLAVSTHTRCDRPLVTTTNGQRRGGGPPFQIPRDEDNLNPRATVLNVVSGKAEVLMKSKVHRERRRGAPGAAGRQGHLLRHTG